MRPILCARRRAGSRTHRDAESAERDRRRCEEPWMRRTGEKAEDRAISGGNDDVVMRTRRARRGRGRGREVVSKHIQQRRSEHSTQQNREINNANRDKNERSATREDNTTHLPDNQTPRQPPHIRLHVLLHERPERRVVQVQALHTPHLPFFAWGSHQGPGDVFLFHCTPPISVLKDSPDLLAVVPDLPPPARLVEVPDRRDPALDREVWGVVVAW